ncbi:choice-of-anchor L domain-containing protein [Nannocystaceae bacterium ST9]
MTFVRSRRTSLLSLGLAFAPLACNGDGGRDTGADEAIDSANDGDGDADTTTASEGNESSSSGNTDNTDNTTNTTTNDGDGDGDGDPTDPPKFDVAAMPDSPDICIVPEHIPCDDLAGGNEEQQAWRALGLGCPGEFPATLDYNGHYLALMVQEGTVGTHDPETYPVLEGSKMVVLSTGIAESVLTPNSDGDTSLMGNDPGNLPAPMVPQKVSDTETCAENESLIGMGDCSNTIWDQFGGTAGAFDYAEMRFSIEVPIAVSGFAYNVAFLSWEYPDFYGWAYNDIYIAWLESETWTGNITFDDFGQPLSLNAGFLDYKDAPNFIDCPLPCDAPELEGTGLEGHGGTKWLTTNVGVDEGDDITVIFAVMDIQDNIVDSVVLLDNFRWTCLGGTPGTVVG